MDALLIAGWLHGIETVRTIDQASIAEARTRVRTLGSGLPRDVVERLVAAASELGTNHLVHAKQGEIGVRAISRQGVAGLEVIAADRGAGIADPDAALSMVAPRSAGSLGVGLGAVRRLTHEVDFDVRMSEGSCVAGRVFAEPLDGKSEVGIYGRPHPDEQVSGDGAALVRDGQRAVLAVIDGLGHGPSAREAAVLAAESVRTHALEGASAVARACHEAVAGTRGAVLSVCDVTAGEVEHIGLGNISVRFVRPRQSRRATGIGAVLGSTGAIDRLRPERFAIERGELVVMYTDGITRAARIADELALLREHPIAIAQHLVHNHARAHDDALVAILSHSC